jgi:hypothetical protein
MSYVITDDLPFEGEFTVAEGIEALYLLTRGDIPCHCDPWPPTRLGRCKHCTSLFEWVHRLKERADAETL